ncbi:hypothetical protein [Actinokineospora globicatena]|uniref:hypothetical protein n=1 Tax=Actinokineospora globicatena TaxID=103729 RepID=UPI0020A569D2|nr:hypothetical protein [Actinokineospora globicatena]MCP2306372.1 hypothetical protein [Actinokineospora globicatena]GLW81799.1 hypothetical protein Aglo01_62800 [Actinokineospora globicatena]GLW88593.1 hypothetical protein Aglo02_62320 [Actinokineospora globicatena]
MAGVEEMRSWVAVATEKARSGIAAIAQASLELDEARGALATASSGREPAELARSQSLLAEAGRSLAEARDTLYEGIAAAEGYLGGR